MTEEMKLKKFAKIFELYQGQLLVYKDFNDEDEDGSPYKYVRCFNHDGVKISTTFSFANEEHRDQAYDDFDDHDAKVFVGHFRELITNEKH